MCKSRDIAWPWTRWVAVSTSLTSRAPLEATRHAEMQNVPLVRFNKNIFPNPLRKETQTNSVERFFFFKSFEKKSNKTKKLLDVSRGVTKCQLQVLTCQGLHIDEKPVPSALFQQKASICPKFESNLIAILWNIDRNISRCFGNMCAAPLLELSQEFHWFLQTKTFFRCAMFLRESSDTNALNARATVQHLNGPQNTEETRN